MRFDKIWYDSVGFGQTVWKTSTNYLQVLQFFHDSSLYAWRKSRSEKCIGHEVRERQVQITLNFTHYLKG